MFWGSVPEDGVDGGDAFGAGAALECGELDEDGDAENLGAAAAGELAAGFDGAAGSEEVVDEKDALPRLEGIGVHFEGVFAVLEGVGHAVDGAREFARFADGDEAGGEGLGDGDPEDKPA